jgi:hypothetical protein
MRWSLFVAFFALGLVAAVFVARSGSAQATDGTLAAAVGPGFSISLTQGGSAVTTLAPGTYTVNVSDMSTLHNFHLSGPGVNQATAIATTGSVTWTVTLSAGSYHFQCDMHPTILHGDFTVGSSGGTTTAPPTTSPPATTSTTTSTATTTSPVTTTSAGTTTTVTTAPVTTTGPDSTTTTPGTTSTVAAAPPAPKLTARLAKLQATRSRVSVTVTLNRAGQASADLFDGHGRRIAHAATRVRSSAKLTLRPGHRMRPGRYAIRLRVTAAGHTLVVSRALRIA